MNNTTVNKPFILLNSANDISNNFFAIHTGQILPEFIGCEIGGILVHDSSILYFASYPNLLEHEKKEMREGEFKARVAYMNGEIFILLKFGSLPWSDIAYTPYLSNDIKVEKLPEQYVFTIIPIEGTTGEVQGIHLHSADADFSAKFNMLIKEQLHKPFCLQQHYENVHEVQRRFSTKQLLKFAL